MPAVQDDRQLAYHFISGLPRSGSTLLSAILRQNPRFYANITSPVYALADRMIDSMGAEMKYSSAFDDAKRAVILRGLFRSYYYDVADTVSVVFDTNRLWTANAAMLQVLFPESRIICCVRNVTRILDSFETIFRKNPLQYNSMFAFKNEPSIYGRVQSMMNARDGVVGAPHSALRSLWFTEFAKKMIVVRYESLAKNPADTLKRLYASLGEPLYQHDFDDVAYEEKEYDHRIGLNGLHTVRGKVEFRERPLTIPPDVFQNYAKSNFWDYNEENIKGVEVI